MHTTQNPVVWAVNDEKIRDYLLPRAAVVAIEASWWNRGAERHEDVGADWTLQCRGDPALRQPGATPLPNGDEVTYAYTRESFKPTFSR